MIRTAAEQKADFERAMGLELGGLHHVLRQYTGALYSEWEQYRAMFGYDEARYNFVMRSAPGFFKVAQDAIWSDLVLGVSKLTGRPMTMGRDNVSFQAIPELIVDPAHRASVQAAVDNATSAAAFTTEPRNRYFAHLDRELILNPGPIALTLGSRLQMRAALEAITNAVNTTARAFGLEDSSFESFGALSDGADTLVLILERGKAAIDAEHAARFAGLGSA